MADADIVALFFPNQSPKADNKRAAVDYRTAFWNICKARGMTERQIAEQWSQQFKGK